MLFAIDFKLGKPVYLQIVDQVNFLRNNHHSPLKKEARVDLLTREIDQAVIQAHHLQIEREDFLRLARERFDLLAEQREEAQNGTNK
jgi:DNA-binding transcriptional regulator YhcF (GntR family)